MAQRRYQGAQRKGENGDGVFGKSKGMESLGGGGGGNKRKFKFEKDYLFVWKVEAKDNQKKLCHLKGGFKKTATKKKKELENKAGGILNSTSRNKGK